MRIPFQLLFLVVTSALCSVSPGHAQSESAKAEKAAPELNPRAPNRQRLVEIYGQWIEMSRNDFDALELEKFVDEPPFLRDIRLKKNVDTPKFGTFDVAVIKNDGLRETLTLWVKQNRAKIKDLDFLTVESGRRGNLCFVEAKTVSLADETAPKGNLLRVPTTFVVTTKTDIEVCPVVHNDDTITIVIQPGTSSTTSPLPPPLTSKRTSLIFATDHNRTFILGGFSSDNSKTSPVSLFLFTMRIIEPETTWNLHMFER